ncbi:ABC transporter substrate-binding protein [Atribacter laminatus]|uniref:Erythritol/L-threitol-binding protein n=1 Tax=Atribacter laminatus TaxID=2847778 RepID=A0A7T1AND4_ATRLM|nr:sugar ABC transporter substrate-binding protein [Atribacter laminatus]QPM69109.1 Erythritol/L-threitol-binding protein [Atribacter laminatus]
MNKKYYFVFSLILVSLLCLGFSTIALGWSWEEASEPYKGTTINVLTIPHPTAIEPVKPLIQEFEKMTGIKVNMEYLERVSLGTKQEMELGAHTGAYDVMHMDTSKLSRYYRADWAYPLNDFFDDPKLTSPEFVLDDFVKIYVDLVTMEGKIFGIPFTGESTIIFYLPQVLEEKGIAGPPSTFEEIEDIAAKIHNPPDFAGFGTRARRGEGMNVSCNWAAWLWGYGGSYFDENGKPALDSPEAILATQKYAELIQKYGPPGGGDFTHYELYTLFAQGNLGMYLDASVFNGIFEDKTKSSVVGKWDAAPVPAGPKNRTTSAYSHAMMIANDSKNKEAAWLFIQWFTSKDVQFRSSTIEGGGPGIVRLSVMETPEYIAKWGSNNWINANVESLKYGRSDYRPTYLPDWPQIGDTIGAYVQEVIVGEKNAETAMTELNKWLIEFMDEKGYPDWLPNFLKENNLDINRNM